MAPPPKTGRGSGKDNWLEYARANDVDVSDDDTKEAIIAAVEAAGVPTEGDEEPSDRAPASVAVDLDGDVPGVSRGEVPHVPHNALDDDGVNGNDEKVVLTEQGAATDEARLDVNLTPVATGTVSLGKDADYVELEEDLEELFVVGRSKTPSTRLVAPAGRVVPQALIDATNDRNDRVREILESFGPPPVRDSRLRAPRGDADGDDAE